MPNKLTDAEIKKALGICSSEHLGCEDGCPLKGMNCRFEMPKFALDLINRLDGENEKNENIIRIADKTIETLKAEIERLKKSIELMKGVKCVYSYDGETLEYCTTSPCPISKTVDQIKAEAYNKFAYLLKRIPRASVFKNEIDNLLNKLVGG